MSFMSSIESTLNNDFNESYTENGALGFRTTGKELLDLNFKTSSFRNESEHNISQMFERAFAEEKKYALKWLFFLRDARGGLGERRSFRIIMKHLAKTEHEFCKALIPLVGEYGRFDDLFVLFETECKDAALKLIKKQLELDVAGMKT